MRAYFGEGRRATGPFGARKRRDRYNAVKNGLFARTIPLIDESAVEYEVLITSLWNKYEPSMLRLELDG